MKTKLELYLEANKAAAEIVAEDTAHGLEGVRAEVKARFDKLGVHPANFDYFQNVFNSHRSLFVALAEEPLLTGPQ